MPVRRQIPADIFFCHDRLAAHVSLRRYRVVRQLKAFALFVSPDSIRTSDERRLCFGKGESSAISSGVATIF